MAGPSPRKIASPIRSVEFSSCHSGKAAIGLHGVIGQPWPAALQAPGSCAISNISSSFEFFLRFFPNALRIGRRNTHRVQLGITSAPMRFAAVRSERLSAAIKMLTRLPCFAQGGAIEVRRNGFLRAPLPNRPRWRSSRFSGTDANRMGFVAQRRWPASSSVAAISKFSGTVSTSCRTSISASRDVTAILAQVCRLIPSAPASCAAERTASGIRIGHHGAAFRKLPRVNIYTSRSLPCGRHGLFPFRSRLLCLFAFRLCFCRGFSFQNGVKLALIAPLRRFLIGPEATVTARIIRDCSRKISRAQCPRSNTDKTT